MNDIKIRTALKRELPSWFSYDPSTIIIDEFGVRHGAARIDIAVINGSLRGYEIKSDKDTLNRLPSQVAHFSSVFDRVTLVVGYRHAFNAIKMVPEWWGIKIAEKGSRGGVRFYSVQRPRNNPATDICSIVKLLWRDEALALLDEFSSAKGVRSKARNIIYEKLVEDVDSELLRNEVRKQIKSRSDLTFDE